MNILSKRQFSTDKLKQKDSKWPVIRLKRVTLSLKHLWSHVMRCTNDGEGSKQVGGG